MTHASTACDEYLSGDVLVAAQVCAVPHWLDDELAVRLLECNGSNGSSPAMVAAVKRLPFVRSFERVNWRIDEDARTKLLAGLRETDRYTRLSRLLAERFATEHDTSPDSGARTARTAQWRAAYHYADVAPSESAARLADLVSEAAGCNRVADLEVAIELFEQHQALAPYVVELAYARGRLRYATGERRAARADFEIVWNAGRAEPPTHVSGHLMSVIDIQRGNGDAETLNRLARAAEVAGEIGDRHGRWMIINTLVAEVLREPSRRVSVDIAGLAKEAADYRTDAIACSMLGAAQLRDGDYEAAEQSLRRATDLAGPRDAPVVSTALNSWVFAREKRGDVTGALELLDRKLTFELSRGEAADEYVVKTAGHIYKSLKRASPAAAAAWTVIESSGRCLSYALLDHLVVVDRARDGAGALAIPPSHRGAWMDRHDRERRELGSSVELASLLHGRRGAVLDRRMQS